MKKIIQSFQQHQVQRHSASMSYFLFIGLGSILVIITNIISLLLDNQTAKQYLLEILSYFFGFEISNFLLEIMLTQQINQGISIFSIIILLITSTAALTYFQDSLNQMLDIKNKNTIKNILKKRLYSLITIILLSITIIFLIVTATIISLILSSQLIQTLSIMIQLIITTIFFYIIYSYVPSKKLNKKSILKGTIFTSTLLITLKTILDIYINTIGTLTIDNLIGLIAFILIGIYLAMNIIFVGAIIISLDNHNKRIYKNK